MAGEGQYHDCLLLQSSFPVMSHETFITDLPVVLGRPRCSLLKRVCERQVLSADHPAGVSTDTGLHSTKGRPANALPHCGLDAGGLAVPMPQDERSTFHGAMRPQQMVMHSPPVVWLSSSSALACRATHKQTCLTQTASARSARRT